MIEPTEPKGRFVAGAVCPECGQLDRIKLFQLGDDQQRRLCVACGFSDEGGTQVPAADGAAPAESVAGGKFGADGGVLEEGVSPVILIGDSAKPPGRR